MIQITDLTYRIAGRTLFDKANLFIQKGSKVGLVGRNGAGKTTLFHLLNQNLEPESGSISIQNQVRIGYVEQEAPDTDTSLIDFVLSADTERTKLLTLAETETDATKISDIHNRLIDIDAHSANARASTVLKGLGFEHETQSKPCADLSGGWRMRVSLAAILFSQPDLLLLDEPTNYLDLEGTLWLENYLSRYPHTVIIISHDQSILNKAANSIVHVDELKLTTYRGGYDQFKKQRIMRMELAQKQLEKQVANRKHLEAFVNRFRAKASKARQAQSRIKMLEKLEPISAIIDTEVKPIKFPTPIRALSPPLIALENVSTGYGETTVLKDLNLRIDSDDRIALLGSNGNGKSTFAKLLSGRIPKFGGEFVKSSKLLSAYFSQHQLDELEPDQSSIEHIQRLLPEHGDSIIRSKISQFGLPTDRMGLAIKSLSGGEKARLLLGLSTLSNPHLIILDEPTNHLDIDSRDALLHAINEYNGAVILISHDQQLISTCADQLWLVDNGTIESFDGDLNDYRKYVLQTQSKQKNSANGKISNSHSQAAQKRKDSANQRVQLAEIKKELKRTERNIESLQKTIAEIDQKLSSQELYQDQPEEVSKYAKARADAQKKLNELEEKWLSLTSEYEDSLQGSEKT